MVICPGARCRLAHAQLMPLPLTISCSSKIQIGFTFLVPAHLGSLGQRAVKRVCVCVSFLKVALHAKGNCWDNLSALFRPNAFMVIQTMKITENLCKT